MDMTFAELNITERYILRQGEVLDFLVNYSFITPPPTGFNLTFCLKLSAPIPGIDVFGDNFNSRECLGEVFYDVPITDYEDNNNRKLRNSIIGSTISVLIITGGSGLLIRNRRKTNQKKEKDYMKHIKSDLLQLMLFL